MSERLANNTLFQNWSNSAFENIPASWAVNVLGVIVVLVWVGLNVCGASRLSGSGVNT